MRFLRPRRSALALVLAASLIGACGDDEESGSADGQTVTETVTVEEPADTATDETTTTDEATATDDDADDDAREREGAGEPRRVTRRQAVRIARRKAGGGRVTDVERDDENDRPVWKVEIDRGRVEHEISVAIRGGRVLEHERDRDD